MLVRCQILIRAWPTIKLNMCLHAMEKGSESLVWYKLQHQRGKWRPKKSQLLPSQCDASMLEKRCYNVVFSKIFARLGNARILLR